ncbi:hypothetical protein GOGPGP_GOGPGP_15370, partial [Dysosmobacter welbionis]
HGGEHPGGLHRRGRAPECGQGPDGDPGVGRHRGECLRPGDHGRPAAAGPDLRRVRRARRRHWRRRREEAL